MNKSGSSFWKASGGILGLLIFLGILIAVNVIVGNIRLRKDFTGDKFYTLSSGSKSVLKKLDREVRLSLFFSNSPQVPYFIKDYAKRVEDFLREYELAAGGKLKVEKYDPQPDSDAEDLAEKYDVPGQQITLGGPSLYFGIVAVCGNSEAMIPVLDWRAADTLEYDITRLIYQVTQTGKPTVGIMSIMPVLGIELPPQMKMQGQEGPQPWVAFNSLKDYCSLVTISTDTETIDEKSTPALIIVHPKKLPEKTLMAIDQYLLAGGRLIVLLDPMCFSDTSVQGQNSPFGRPPASSDMPELLNAWGVKYEPDKIVADISAISRGRVGNRIEDNPMWLSLRAEHANKNDIITSKLQKMFLPLAGSFTVSETDAIKATPLLMTSSNSCMVNAMIGQMGAEAVKREFKRGGIPLKLAVRLTGKFKTAFPDGITVRDEKSDQAAAETGETSAGKDTGKKIMPIHMEGNSSVVLVGDVDMFADRFCVEQMSFFGITQLQPANDNITFLANLVGQLVGSSDLIGIRSKTRTERPFVVVMEMERRARMAYQEQEDDLMTKLRETQQKLSDLQAQKDPKQQMLLSKEQKQAIAAFRKEEGEIKQRLKLVQKNLRREVENLGVLVKVFNIATMPLLVGIAGIFYGLYRRKR